jgi:hypothetical protein
MKKIIFLLFIISCLKANTQILKDCSSCSTQIIKTEQIKNLSIDEIRFITNDLFARKGYKFNSANVDSYYLEKIWYKPISDNKNILFNDIENQNIKLFQDKTTEIKKEQEKLMTELKNFKSKILSSNNLILESKYGYTVTDKDNNEAYKYLTETFKRINLDDINWSFDVGIYKVTIDNGDIVIGYEIRISKDGIIVKYGNQGGSEIGKQLYPNDQITEFAFWWEFEWKNNKLKFLKMNVAG